ncbi:MAG: DUF4976 domain-containing protein [Verrucomicrobia bacterium]|nr:DUF4976 domain-containing protein [Verrucomicrobiota bacterium]
MHFGVRTATHKLIYYEQKNAYEMFDLVKDPTEQNNQLYSASESTQPAVTAKFNELKAAIARLQKEYKDEGRYTDKATWPPGGVDGPFDEYQPMGRKTVSEAIAASVAQ